MSSEHLRVFNKESDPDYVNRIHGIRDEKKDEVSREALDDLRIEREKAVIDTAAEAVINPYDPELYEKWRKAQFIAEGLHNDPRPVLSPNYERDKG